MAKSRPPRNDTSDLNFPYDEELQKALEKLDREYFQKLDRMKKDVERFLSIDEAIETYLKSLESETAPDRDPPDMDS